MRSTNGPNPNIDAIVAEIGIDTEHSWINALKTLPPDQLGVIKLSGKVLEEPYIGQLAAELSYLSEKGFYLPVILGGGPQYNQLPAMKASKRVNDLRITTPELLKEMLPVAKDNQDMVVDAIKAAGGDAVAIPYSNFVAQRHGYEIDLETGEKIDTCFVGDLISVKTSPIIEAIYDKKTPVISHFGVGGSQVYNMNASTFASGITMSMQARKLIMEGDLPILDGDGNVIRTIQSEADFINLVDTGVISGGAITKVNDAFRTLNYLGPGHAVHITSPSRNGTGIGEKSTGLLEELLGDGTGTKIVLPHLIKSYPIVAVNTQKLAGMINDAFVHQNKKLTADYFDKIAGNDPTIYLESNNRGGAITYPLVLGDGSKIEYLDKLFTGKDYEGQGIATSIINKIYLHEGTLAWRTSITNTCAIPKYQKIVDHYGGFHENGGEYMVFGIGIPEEKKAAVISEIKAVPKTLETMYAGKDSRVGARQ